MRNFFTWMRTFFDENELEGVPGIWWQVFEITAAHFDPVYFEEHREEKYCLDRHEKTMDIYSENKKEFIELFLSKYQK